MKTKEIIKRATESLMQIACESQLLTFSGDESSGISIKELFNEVLKIWFEDVASDNELIQATMIAFSDEPRDKRQEILSEFLSKIVFDYETVDDTTIGYQQWLDGKFVEEDDFNSKKCVYVFPEDKGCGD